MTTDGQRSLAQRLTGIDEIECVTPDLNGVPRGKVMSAEGFLEGRALTWALAAEAGDIVAADITPVSDLRGSADFRREMVRVNVRRTVAELFGLDLALEQGELA